LKGLKTLGWAFRSDFKNLRTGPTKDYCLLSDQEATGSRATLPWLRSKVVTPHSCHNQEAATVGMPLLVLLNPDQCHSNKTELCCPCLPSLWPGTRTWLALTWDHVCHHGAQKHSHLSKSCWVYLLDRI
jgi:hypothetical protein